MAGGMKEWVADVHGERTWMQTSAEAEPSLPIERDSSERRIARSGNWASSDEHCRSASRARFFALTRNTALGFRVYRALIRTHRDPL